MKEVVESGHTVEDAKKKAMKELGVKSEDEVEVDIIDEGSKGIGIFGWGTRFARVRVRLIEDLGEIEEEEIVKKPGKIPERIEIEKKPTRKKKPETREISEKPVSTTPQTTDEKEQKIEVEGEYAPENIIKKILNLMGLQGDIVKTRVNGNEVCNIKGEDLGILIGKHGQTLESVQFVVNLILMRKTGTHRRITIDVEGYRARREKSLRELARRLAEKVKREKRKVALEPMLPSERRIIHMALQKNPHVTTFSKGEEPMRKVIISPKRAR